MNSVLVERDGLLARLTALATDARSGRGRLAFVGGEAGVGKTSLVRALGRALDPGWTVRTGAADGVTTAEALGAFQDAVPELAALLAGEGDRQRLFRALRQALTGTPTLLVLEDLHWADEATLDALRFLGRRLDGLALLAVVTYRDDEVTARHPLSLVMGDLVALPEVTRLTVPPLTLDGVAALVAGSGAGLDAATLHERTGGNAFFVTEVLGAADPHDEAVPATVRDAVLARASRLSPAAARVADAAAILGTAADAALLAAVSGEPAGALDECVARGVLVGQEAGYAFRHELARRSVEESLAPGARRDLHARALAALSVRTPDDHRTLAHHAAGCGDASAARHATLAGRRAARLSAHREAAAQFRIALRAGGDAGDRAGMLEALSYECYLTDQLPEAVAARQQALELHELAGDALRVGDAQRWLSRLEWFLGHGADAERYGSRAVATLEPLGDGHELAMAYSNLAQLRMLAHDEPGAVRWGERALALADRLGDDEVRIHALNNVGTAMLAGDHPADGAARLRRSLDLALAADAAEHAARAHTNLTSMAIEQRRYADGIANATAGIAYCEERDLDSWVRYMQAWLAVALGDAGRFDEAADLAARLLAFHGLAPITAIPAATTAARVAARRGEDGTAWVDLAASLADRTGELQRTVPAACAAAEVAWLEGRVDQIPGLTAAAWEQAVGHDDRWLAAELGWWRSLAGLSASADAPEPFAAMAAGRWEEAALGWEALGSPLWAAYSRALDPEVASAERAVAALEAIGAARAVEAVLRTRRDRGLPLPRRSRGAARANAAHLTARELDVLRRLAEGLSTADIAEVLVLSPRTVEHHVSSILRKLDAPTRARAVAAARGRGLLGDAAG